MTCTTDGEDYRNCTRGGCTETDTRIIPAAHTWSTSWTVLTPATCLAAAVETNSCTLCTETQTRISTTAPALGHEWGAFAPVTAATCTAAGSEVRSCQRTGCTVTESRNILALGHSFGEWVRNPAPTCTAAGTQTRDCSRCTHKETQSLQALGHRWGQWVTVVVATASAPGAESRTCLNCSELEGRPIPQTGSGNTGTGGGGGGGNTGTGGGGGGSGGGVTGGTITPAAGSGADNPQQATTLPNNDNGQSGPDDDDDDDGNNAIRGELPGLDTATTESGAADSATDSGAGTEAGTGAAGATISSTAVEAALASINLRMVLGEGDSTVISASSLQTIKETDKPLIVVLPNGLTLFIDPESITEDARDIDLNFDVRVSTEDDVIAGVAVPANSILISPPTHGQFGFTVSFDLSAEFLADAGITAENARKYHVCAEGNVTHMRDSIDVNDDGSITVHISHASAYYLTEHTGGMNLFIWILIALGAAFIVFGAVMLIRHKRNTKDKPLADFIPS